MTLSSNSDPISVTDRAASIGRIAIGPGAVSVFVLVGVLLTLDPSDCWPTMPEGPGVTLDESFNVQMGAYLVESLKSYGFAILHPDSVQEVFGNPAYNPDHPPLGRLWLGVFHQLTQSLAAPAGIETLFVTASARVGSAVAFALTIFLVGVFTGSRYGRLAGFVASSSLALMPRLFGHAHLASLETVMNLTWTLAILGAAHVWTKRQMPAAVKGQDDSGGQDSGDPPSDWAAILFGLLISLALLTKIQAVILPPLVGVWSLWHWRTRAVRPLTIGLSAAGVGFLVGWPWLWIDLPGHTAEYFGRTTGRLTLHCWYFGQQFADTEVPWHYSWVMLLATVPIGLSALAFHSVIKRRHSLLRDPAVSLLLGSVLAPLVLFSLPGVAVYDGVRLFLIAFPGVAILAGIGAADFCRLFSMSSRKLTAGVGFFIALQAIGIATTAPYSLSYYSLVVGGLAGAEQLGMERTYWGDTLSRSFFQQKAVADLTAGTTIQVAPVLHQFQLDELARQSPLIQRRQWKIVPYQSASSESGRSTGETEYLAVFHRRADAPTEGTLIDEGWELSSQTKRQGVTLASFWRRASIQSR